MPYFEMHHEMLLCRPDFLQTKTIFWGFKHGNIHVENLVISITMDISMAHGKMPGDCTDDSIIIYVPHRHQVRLFRVFQLSS